jgi:deoxycytidylate deaminase
MIVDLSVQRSHKSHLKKSVLNQTVAVAMASNAPKKIGAVLLRKNRIVSSAVNDYTRTHPVQYWAAKNAAKIWNDPQLEMKSYLHAEVSSLIKAKEDADTIIVCRVGGHGGRELRYARPCRVCSEYIRRCSNVVHIHYSTPKGFRYEYWGN